MWVSLPRFLYSGVCGQVRIWSQEARISPRALPLEGLIKKLTNSNGIFIQHTFLFFVLRRCPARNDPRSSIDYMCTFLNFLIVYFCSCASILAILQGVWSETNIVWYNNKPYKEYGVKATIAESNFLSFWFGILPQYRSLYVFLAGNALRFEDWAHFLFTQKSEKESVANDMWNGRPIHYMVLMYLVISLVTKGLHAF